jgi:carbonic anhydrase
LRLAGGAALGLAAPPGFAAARKAPPKAENVVGPDAALARLMKGNERYVEGVARRHDFRHEREALTKGQNPYAGVLSCADSRIAPEYAFDAGRGDLFVCRVAGNLVNDDVVASLEYAVSVLNTPLIMVLGHQACGAVDAAIKSIKDGTTLPGHLPSLVTALAPAVKAALDQPGDTLDNAIRQNVVLTVAGIKAATPILSKAVEDNKLRVVGAVYDLSDGRVTLVK